MEVNLTTQYRAATEKSEEEAEKDIRKLLSSNFEEVWIYLSEKNLWYEIGSGEKYVERPEFVSTVNLDKEFLEYVIEERPNATIVHFHPNEIKSPSRIDIFSAIFYSLEFYRKPTQNNLDFKIHSKEGVTTYALTKNGLKFFSAQPIEEIKEVASLISEEIFNTLERGGKIGDNLISVNFRPYTYATKNKTPQ